MQVSGAVALLHNIASIHLCIIFIDIAYAAASYCGEPAVVQNARRMGNSYNQFDEIRYICEDCYEGGGSTVCQSNGKWTDTPACTGKYR